MPDVPRRTACDRLVEELRVSLADEEPETAQLIRALRHVRQRGVFSRREFLTMCRWKSPRSGPQCATNTAAVVRRVAREVLAARSEQRRMELLLGLRGVGVPTASAILTLVDPRRYGVLDIRAWQLLHERALVTANPRGTGFRAAHWHEYLEVLRQLAARLGAPVRQVEWTLFLHHRRRPGLLYPRADGARRPAHTMARPR
jgi:hypothetical protein